MKILVTGAGGMLGKKLVERLIVDKKIGNKRIKQIIAVDAVMPKTKSPIVKNVKANIADAKAVRRLINHKPDVVFHLAAIVSGEAETNFAKGYKVNLTGTQNIFGEIVRLDKYCPRVVYASSIAVFGAPFPNKISDEFLTAPLTSYGTQKAIGELLLADYTRKGFMDGIGLRFPTIVVRPGKANLAASGFFSNIIREPLVGKTAVLPVPKSVKHWVVSPRRAVEFCLHAATMDTKKIGPRRNITLPGLAITVGQMLKALERVGGKKCVALIKNKPNKVVAEIVQNWPKQFNAQKAKKLGFKADKSFDEIIKIHIKDEL